MPKILNFKAVIEQNNKGYFIADVPAIPGCHSQGKSYEEVVKNIKEAIKLCLEVAKRDKEYRSKIDFDESGQSAKFIGVTQVDVTL